MSSIFETQQFTNMVAAEFHEIAAFMLNQALEEIEDEFHEEYSSSNTIMTDAEEMDTTDSSE